MATSIHDSLVEIDKIIGGTKNVSPGDFELKVCEMHHGDSATHTIAEQVVSLHLFEDIETIGVHGWLDMEDDLNIIESGLIIGEELLYLKFGTGGTREAGIDSYFDVDYTKHPLYIYSVENLGIKAHNAGRTLPGLTYRLHFCSTELIKDSRIRVSKTYKGQYNNIVKDVLENELKTIKKIYTEDTIGIKHIISPNMRPFDFIRSIIPNSQAKEVPPPSDFGRKFGQSSGKLGQDQLFKGRRSDYGFYETVTRTDDSGGFHFKPLNIKADSTLTFGLVVQKSTLAPDGAPVTGSRGWGFPGAMLRSHNFKMVDNGNKYKTIRSGTWASKIITHDTTTKSYDIYKSDYLKQLKHLRFSHISQTPSYEGKDIGKPFSEWPDGATRFNSSSSKSISSIGSGIRAEYPWGTASFQGDTTQLHRQMQLGHLLGFQRLEITLPGISGLNVGMAAFCDWPSIGERGGQPPHGKRLWEARNDNVWLITKVAHLINVKHATPSYNCKVQLANTMSVAGQVLPKYGKLGK